jgi:hypothetical protein
VTAKELAQILNGREIGNEISKTECDRAEKDRLVVIFGASDDLAEIRGAVYDEVSCYDGGFIYFVEGTIYETKCGDDECPHEESRRENAKVVEAIWGQGPSWTYKTEIPHETFDILEDGEVFCRGIVFHLGDL